MAMDDVAGLVPGLKKSGLSEKAALVYTCLLDSGGAYPSQIADETRINRSTVYKILTDLSIKGLINEIQKGKKLYYQIEKPNKLLRYAEHQVVAASDAYESVQKIYPELEGYFAALENKPRMFYFEGHESVLSIYEDQLIDRKPFEMLAIANTANVLDFLPSNFYKHFRRRKVELGVTTRGILPAEAKSQTILDLYSDVPEKYQAKIRYLPREEFPFKGEIIVYGEDRVSITNLGPKRVSGIIIEDQGFNQMMRMIFDLAWKAASPSIK